VRVSSWRKIVVDGKNYRWRGSSFVIVQDENGRRVAAGNATEIKGLTWNDWERGHWKRTNDGMMRPGEVAAFVRLSLTLASEERHSG
jgi:hypothetical protein